MSERILFVDDDENILAAYQRQLRKQFQIEIALGSLPGLQLVSSGEPYAVVVSDLKMPGMDGFQFLAKVKQFAPNTVHIMLTGNADLQNAIEAVNQGYIFRFLTKPCSNETLVQALQAGLRQYRLIVGEKELLEQTLNGAIGVLTDILSILDPQSFGLARTIRDSVREITKALNAPDTWDLELAAMFCEIGRVTIPASIIAREKAGATLSDTEQDMLMRLPEVGYRLLSKIPRLESAARTVLYCKKNFDGSGFPKDQVAAKQIPLGSRIIKIISDLVQLESEGVKTETAFQTLRYRQGFYDPEILDSVYRHRASSVDSAESAQKSICSVSVGELEVGHLLLSDIVTESGTLLITAGNRITESLREIITNSANIQSIKEPIKVVTRRNLLRS